MRIVAAVVMLSALALTFFDHVAMAGINQRLQL
jgi:hypothetical protein